MSDPTRPIELSVIVPTFRRPAMLRALLPALEEQARATDGPGAAEIVVVDNDPQASAAAVVAEAAARSQGRVRHVHAPQPGVAHARNAGVAAARGEWVAFIDDDEIPAPDWLAAFRGADMRDADAAFGRVVPRYGAPAEGARRALLDRIYLRDLAMPDGAALWAHWPHLGTGNSMFRRAVLNGVETFDTRFNRTGGEDSFLLLRLIDRGARLVWRPGAVVEEIVPADRMTPAYLARRRFNQGQLRCLLLSRRGGRLGPPRVALWMGVGLAQTALYGARWAAAAPFDAERAAEFAVKLRGGLGKLMWFTAPGAVSYSGG